MQDPEKEGQTKKQLNEQNQKVPRAKPVYIPAGYETVFLTVESLRTEGRPVTELTIAERIKQLEEEDDDALYQEALREIQDQQD